MNQYCVILCVGLAKNVDKRFARIFRGIVTLTILMFHYWLSINLIRGTLKLKCRDPLIH